MEQTIYHGTPMTPRAALQQMAGRAFCVSFYRPDDAEVVEAISPAVMFRQRGVLILAGRITSWARMGRGSGLATVLQMAGAAIEARPMGCHTGHAGSAKPDQRWTIERLAVWAMGCAAMAHGQPDRSPVAPVRQIRPRVFGLDRTGRRQDGGLRGMVPPHGRGCSHYGQSMASAAHDARRDGCAGVSLPQCGQHQPSAERAFV